MTTSPGRPTSSMATRLRRTSGTSSYTRKDPPGVIGMILPWNSSSCSRPRCRPNGVRRTRSSLGAQHGRGHNERAFTSRSPHLPITLFCARTVRPPAERCGSQRGTQNESAAEPAVAAPCGTGATGFKPANDTPHQDQDRRRLAVRSAPAARCAAMISSRQVSSVSWWTVTSSRTSSPNSKQPCPTVR